MVQLLLRLPVGRGGVQPRSQGLGGDAVTKTLVKFVLSFQNFGKKIACAVRHNRIAITVEYGCVSLRMRFFPQNLGTIKRILPGLRPQHVLFPTINNNCKLYIVLQLIIIVNFSPTSAPDLPPLIIIVNRRRMCNL